MKILLNNKSYDVAQDATLDDLATLLELPLIGVAVAIDNVMVPRTQWKATTLTEGCKVLIIKAVCGG